MAAFVARHINLGIGVLFTGLLATVLMNALVWQKSPHPAPLFAHTMQVETNSVPKGAETPSEAAPAPTSLHPATPPAANAQPAEKAAIAPHGRDPMAEVAGLPTQKPAAARDPIAQLLKSAPSSEPKATDAKSTEVSSKSILAAQRALMKLGYVVKPDGAAGPAFRQALERFERDRNFPIQGTLSAKLMHELSAQSGIAVE